MHSVRFPYLLPLFVACLPVPVQAEVDEALVLAVARASYGVLCNELPEETSGLLEWMIQRYETIVQAEGLSPLPTVVWQLQCNIGNYGRASFFWVDDYDGHRHQLIPLAFAMPEVDVVLERPQDYESPVREVRLTGWRAITVLGEASFDPTTLIFTDHSKFRNIGDAYSYGTWRLEINGPVIQTFEIDASYDGEQNPVSIYPAP